MPKTNEDHTVIEIMRAERAVGCAECIAMHGPNITYPSRPSARHVREVIAGLLGHIKDLEYLLAMQRPDYKRTIVASYEFE